MTRAVRSVRPQAWIALVVMTSVFGATRWTTSGAGAGIYVIAGAVVGGLIGVVIGNPAMFITSFSR